MRILGIAAVALALTGFPAVAQPAPKWSGVWRNATNSVHIRAAPCGRRAMCGTVIWASPKVRADVAARGRTLVGAQLFRGFRDVGGGVWEGEVYVPDIGHSFSGTLTPRGANTLVGEGCLFGRMGCREQTWTRVAAKK